MGIKYIYTSDNSEHCSSCKKPKTPNNGRKEKKGGLYYIDMVLKVICNFALLVSVPYTIVWTKMQIDDKKKKAASVGQNINRKPVAPTLDSNMFVDAAKNAIVKVDSGLMKASKKTSIIKSVDSAANNLFWFVMMLGYGRQSFVSVLPNSNYNWVFVFNRQRRSRRRGC